MQKSAIWIVSSVFTFLQICQCVWSKYNIHCCEKLQLAASRFFGLSPLKTFGFCDGSRWAWLSSDLQAFLPFSTAWLMPPSVSVWATQGQVQQKVSGSVCGTSPYARFMMHSRKNPPYDLSSDLHNSYSITRARLAPVSHAWVCLLLLQDRWQLPQPVESSRQVSKQAGIHTHTLMPQSCHRNSTVVGTTHSPQELVLVGPSEAKGWWVLLWVFCWMVRFWIGPCMCLHTWQWRCTGYRLARRFQDPFLSLFLSNFCLFSRMDKRWMGGRFQMLIVIWKTCVILSAKESLPHFFNPLMLKDFERVLFYPLYSQPGYSARGCGLQSQQPAAVASHASQSGAAQLRCRTPGLYKHRR